MAAGLLLLLLAALVPVVSAHSGRSLVVDPPIARPGQVLGVHGAFLWTDETVVISLVGADGSGVRLGDTTTDGSGSLETTVTLPDDTRPGTYRIRATASNGDSADAELVVDPGLQLPVLIAIGLAVAAVVGLLGWTRLRGRTRGELHPSTDGRDVGPPPVL